MMKNVMISDTLVYYLMCTTIKNTFKGMKNCNKNNFKGKNSFKNKGAFSI